MGSLFPEPQWMSKSTDLGVSKLSRYDWSYALVTSEGILRAKNAHFQFSVENGKGMFLPPSEGIATALRKTLRIGGKQVGSPGFQQPWIFKSMDVKPANIKIIININQLRPLPTTAFQLRRDGD